MKSFLKFFLFMSGLLFLAALFIWLQIPSVKKIKGCITTTMFDIDLCPQNKNYVPLKNISNFVQRAIIQTEDSTFYTHNGFDSEGIERCVEKLKEKHRIVCGGSTISQQLAKNLFLSKNKTFYRKGIEALITIKLEKNLTKKEILEKYLNVVQFGKNIFGIKQASQFYFKKSPGQLDPVEAAFLAMVLPNPEKYSQSYYRKDLTKFARRRLTQIIQNMYKFKSLSEEQYVSSLAKLDSFFQSGQSQSTTDDTLTEEDIKEMEDDVF
jgi:monofunctional biosynthetic peptidoglycan transglycosylase